MTNGAPPLLEVRGVTKRFPGVTALKEVNLRLGASEVLAVIGENGAGKSTLMKILAGVQQPDEGDISIEGRPVTIESCRAATDLGIALIHQELNLSDNLSVGANIFLGREPRRFGWIDRQSIQNSSRDTLERIGLDVEPDTIVSALAIGRQQLVEIAKAISADARILIMDEPTSSLSAGEVERLFSVVRDLKSRGVSIIYISHRLGEVNELADRVLVLRDGQNAGHLEKEEIDHRAMVRLMVGRDVSKFYARHHHEPGEDIFAAEGIVTPAWPQRAIDFSLRRGEIVGIAGLVGAGRTELLRVLFGVDHALSGRIVLDGKQITLNSPLDAINAGLALVPEGRKEQGLIVEMSVRENVSLAGLWKNRRRAGMLNRQQERIDTASMIEKLNIKTPAQEQVVRFLSGGNQQKVVLGKWLTMQPSVLFMDEPTRGIDIGAKEEVYKLMESLAQAGMAILFVSSELEEILGMADRTLVMHEGKISGELARDEMSEEAIMHLAIGG